MYLAAAMDFMNNPTVKYGLGLVGGFLWKKAPGTVNRAYPMVAMVASALLTLSGLLTKFLEGFGTQPASFSLAAATGASTVTDAVVALVMGTVLPVIAAVGTHSWWKNVLQWVADGYRIRKV